MNSGTALTALVLGTATWVQLVLVPLLAHPPDFLSVAAGVVALGVLVAGAVVARTRPPAAVLLGAGVYPAALGLFAFALGRQPERRFDAAAQVVAALTVVAFLAALAAWVRTAAPVYPRAVSPVDEPAAKPAGLATALAPPLRHVSLGVLAASAFFAGVLAPALLAARAWTTLEARLGGEELARGRHALVSAAGVLIAVALVLGGGSAALRAAPPRARRPRRAVAYLLWAATACAMRYFLDHAG